MHSEPIAHITTGDPAFLMAFWRGTQIAFDATLYTLPASYDTNNVIPVSDQVLTAERHGNDITVTLTQQQSVQLFGYPTMPPAFNLPTFSMELNNYGGSVRFEKTATLAGFPGASGYTQVSDVTGFQATGSFTSNSPGWNYNAAPVSNAFITMHGIQYYYPPK